MKKIIISMLVAMTLTMQSAVIFAAEASCGHNWVTYSFEKIFEGDKTCTTHENCVIHEIGYNVIEVCNKCGETRQRHFTQETHNL